MIFLEKEHYCDQDCTKFSPVVETREYYVGGLKRADTYIRCEHKDFCESLVKELIDKFTKDQV